MKKLFYTDGSSKGNPGPGGFGVVELNIYDSQTYDNYIKRITLVQCHREDCPNTTNNREELKAILYVVELAAKDPDNKYFIYTDSMYCVNIINNWMWNWAKNDWLTSKKKPVENLDLIKPLWKYFNTPFFNVVVSKVPGHQGEIGNELADKLAIGDIKSFKTLLSSNLIVPFDEDVLLEIL